MASPSKMLLLVLQVFDKRLGPKQNIKFVMFSIRIKQQCLELPDEMPSI